jgi:hypothetical protein
VQLTTISHQRRPGRQARGSLSCTFAAFRGNCDINRHAKSGQLRAGSAESSWAAKARRQDKCGMTNAVVPKAYGTRRNDQQ